MSTFGIIVGAILCIGFAIISTKIIISIVKSIRDWKSNCNSKKEG